MSTSRGTAFTLAVDDEGRLWSWGNNEFGQLGRGSVSGPTSIPQLVDATRVWTAISAAGSTSAGVHS